MLEKQKQREQMMQLQGVENARAELEKAFNTGAVQMLYGNAKVVLALHEELTERYKAIQEARVSGIAARMRGWFREVPAESLAVLALNETISTCLIRDNPSVQLLLLNIGRRVHLEALVLQASKVNPLYVQRTEEYLARSSTKSKQHYSRTMRTAVRNIMQDIDYLLDTEYAQLGKLALNEIIELGVIERTSVTGMHTYTLHQSILEALKVIPALAASRVQLSMLVPPEPWVNITDGGYLTSPWHPLVKRQRYRREDYKEVAGALVGSNILSSATALQEVAFKLDAGMTDLIKGLWAQGGGALGLPTREFREPPVYPLKEGWKDNDNTPENQVAHDTWRSIMHQWYNDKREHSSAVQELAHLVKNIEETEQARWHPVFLDSRGRMYYRGRLNPQGSDRAKSIVQFHNGKALGERGLYWLKVAIANSFGIDTVRFDARVQWVHENLQHILEGAQQPQDSDFFRSNTEAPCMAVAYSRELQQALQLDAPEKFISHVPVTMDATCSGLQHLSALLRDAEGGWHVNLTDNGLQQKSDIYLKVSEVAMRLAARDLTTTKAKYAEFWVRNGLPRSLCKRPVMTYCYGVTLQGVLRYIDLHLHEHKDTLQGELPDFKGRVYCAKLLLEAIALTVPKAAEYMQWLQEAVRSRKGERITWTTATGFKVIQYIEGVKMKRVNIRSCGIRQVVMYERNGCTNSLKMANSIVPNLVHSNDAAHWLMTGTAMRQLGHDVVGIHDSFGTHAANVDCMHEVIRDTFVKLYRDYDLTSNFIQENQIELEAPSLGNLDIELFKKSEFGFC